MSIRQEQQAGVLPDPSAKSAFQQHIHSQQEQEPGYQQLLDMGQTILSLLPSLGLTLATFDNLVADGWKLSPGSNALSVDTKQATPVSSSRNNPSHASDSSTTNSPKSIFAHKLHPIYQTPTFITDAHMAAGCVTLSSLVREFDAGSLAGQLQNFRVHSSSVVETIIEYDSVLPWPLAARHLCVNMLFGVHSPDDGSPCSLLILGRDFQTDEQQSQEQHQSQQHEQHPSGLNHATDSGNTNTQPPAASGIIPQSHPAKSLPLQAPRHNIVEGSCHFSLYIITPLGQGVCRFQRAINVDMHLRWIPSCLMTPMMLQRFKQDLQDVQEQAACFSGSEFECRTKTVPFYTLLQRILSSS